MLVLLYRSPEGEYTLWECGRPGSFKWAYLCLFRELTSGGSCSLLGSDSVTSEQLRLMAEQGNEDAARAWLELNRWAIPGQFLEVSVQDAPLDRPIRRIDLPEPDEGE